MKGRCLFIRTLLIIFLVIVIYAAFKLVVDKNPDGKATKRLKNKSESPDSEIPQEVGMLSEQCPSCGVSIPQQLNSRPVTHCPYCGAVLPERNELIKETLRRHHEREMQRLQLETAQKEAEAEKAKYYQKHTETVKAGIAVGVIVFYFAFMAWLISYLHS